MIGGTGIAAFIVLAVEATVGHLALIVDFSATANPLYRVWRILLPDYLVVTPQTWVLHGVWLVVFVVLAAWGGSREPPRDADGEDDPARSSKSYLWTWLVG